MLNVTEIREKLRTSTLTSDEIVNFSEEDWAQLESEDEELAFDLGVNLGMIHSARQRAEIQIIQSSWADFLDKASGIQADCWGQNPNTIRLLIAGLQHELSQMEARIVEFHKNEEIRARVFGEEVSPS